MWRMEEALQSLDRRDRGKRRGRDPCRAAEGMGGSNSQMAQVFQNLIGNAIKFRNEAPPEIAP